MSPTKEIHLDVTTHRADQIILIKFVRDKVLEDAVRKVNGVKWSKTHTSWYVPYSVRVLNEIKNLFEPISKINAALLKEKASNQSLKTTYTPQSAGFLFNEEVQRKILSYKAWLQSRRYSASTIKTYIESLKIFLKFFYQKTIEDITNEDVIVFNNTYILKNNLSSSYQNQIVNAIKLFFRIIENKAINIDLIHRPKRSHALPNVLSKEEIKQILETHKNVKHKVMLSLIYACGLRRSELLNLKAEHVDSKRGLLIIKQAKGKKDRIVPISHKIITLLREYYKMYKPKYWLFEGQTIGEKYTAESLQNVLKQAIAKVNINKPVTLHWLRHSYATHLLESGTDLRYIQELLGHKSSRTTEIYTHISTKSLQNIKSPFDDL
jgi:integrase/recombinase XerD